MSACSDRGRRQRGDILIEALIGVLLTAIIGAGLSHILARVMLGQRDARVEQLAVEQVRTSLKTQGLALCVQGEMPLALPGELAGAKATVECVGGTADVSFGADYIASGIAKPPRMLVSVSADGLELGGPDLLFDTAFHSGTPAATQ